jgi:hypothetical protein
VSFGYSHRFTRHSSPCAPWNKGVKHFSAIQTSIWQLVIAAAARLLVGLLLVG